MPNPQSTQMTAVMAYLGARESGNLPERAADVHNPTMTLAGGARRVLAAAGRARLHGAGR